MFGARRGACCLLLWAAGCLTAPPDPDQALDDPSCPPILEDRFDDTDEWIADAEPGSEITREPDAVWITSEPPSGDAYADLHSAVVTTIADTQLTAALEVDGDPLGGDTVGGISWDRGGNEEDDYYDLVVDAGRVLAVRKEADGPHVELCSPGCPAYDADLHVRFRLRAVREDVIYEVSPASGGWTELARAPVVPGAYRAVVFAWAAAPDQSDLAATELTWSACGPPAE